MKLRISSDLLTGLLFVALGIFAIVYGWRYPVGTTARMGAGYFPLIISSALTLIGVALMARSFFTAGDWLGSISWRALMLVLAGTLLFGLLIDRIGLFVAGIALVVASRLADRDVKAVETAVLALVLTLGTGLVFLYGLGLPIKMLRY
jgi:putative tricarboxylic transport membrane protein